MRRTLPAIAALAIALPCSAAPFDDISGSWHGAVAMDARNIANVHSVGPFSMNVTRDGEVDGVDANGCRLKGIVKNGLSKNLYDLDVRMRGCHYESFNRRWTGHLARTEDGRMRLALSIAPSTTARETEYMDASGTLAR